MFHTHMFSKPIRQNNILGVLIGGFTLVILLLLAACYIGFQNVTGIRSSAQTLVSQDLSTTNLIDQIQGEQAALSWVFHRMSKDPETLDREKALELLRTTEANMQVLVNEVSGKPQEKMWRGLQANTIAFATEARRLLMLPDTPPNLSRELFKLHGKVLEQVGAIIKSNDQDNIYSQRQIASNTRELVLRSTVLFGSCVFLALLCAVMTVRMTTQLFGRMEWQASELSRVSWHMLENQETTARRFSHELHDELGQSLTAVKANLAALEQASHGEHENPAMRDRIADCLSQVNESIGNVRQLSQLLRPVILDDFGLDAALRWLTERFQQRTSIEVDYRSNFNARLPDETETHLFRISQEALTNIARHSGASRVTMGLSAENGTIRLSVADNGRGLPAAQAEGEVGQRGMGMTGMRARARSIGGELNLQSGNGDGAGNGLAIEVLLPMAAKSNVETSKEDPHPVGR